MNIILIIQILTIVFCYESRIKQIGFDFVSVPVGLAVLSGLNTKLGASILTLSKPLYNGILIAMKPTLILIEIYFVLEILRKFNRWLSKKANARDHLAHDISSWDPPLARDALCARIGVIVLMIASYIGSYLLLEKSQLTLTQFPAAGSIPIIFEQAKVLLITLQALAILTTLFKDEGIISESAMICLVSSICILVASYHQSQVLLTSMFESGLIGE